jgi:hypothetical protein
VKSALDQVGIATTVTGPLLYTILGTVAGVVIIGAGGGLIKPMQSRWESMLNKAETESANVKAQAQSSSSASRRRLPGRALVPERPDRPHRRAALGRPDGDVRHQHAPLVTPLAPGARSPKGAGLLCVVERRSAWLSLRSGMERLGPRGLDRRGGATLVVGTGRPGPPRPDPARCDRRGEEHSGPPYALPR